MWDHLCAVIMVFTSFLENQRMDLAFMNSPEIVSGNSHVRILNFFTSFVDAFAGWSGRMKRVLRDTSLDQKFSKFCELQNLGRDFVIRAGEIWAGLDT